MLGTRTKQVFSYGKRNKRIVNVFEDLGILNPGDTTSQKKNRENLVSPKVVRVKKRHSASPASLKKKRIQRTRVQQIIDIEDGKPPKKPVVDLNTPARQPLGLYPVNVPSSPAVSKNIRKKPRVPGAKGTPLTITKPFSPFVETDIIVLDGSGRRVSQERRVSRPDVQVNPIGAVLVRNAEGMFAERSAQVIDVSDSDGEVAAKLAKLGKRRTRTVIVSSDESDEEPLVLSLQPSPPLMERACRPPLCIRPLVSNTVPTNPKFLQQQPSRLHRDAPTPASQGQAQVTRITRPIPTTYYPTSPPITHARQLTPIGRSLNIFKRPIIAVSPTTPSDVNLSFDFSDLSIAVDDLIEKAQPESLRPLLDECNQGRPHEFSAFIEMFPFDPIVRSTNSMSDVKFRKIGEASYSEVFGIGDVVLKVIPLRPETQMLSSVLPPLMEEKETPPPSDAKDVLKEMIVTRAMGDICSGFVKLLKGYVVRGRYPSLLLDLWDEYEESKGSESVRPDAFNVSQVYAIIVLPNGGPDLEAYMFSGAGKAGMGWRQACSLFWQVTGSLSKAEELVSFEHRDLHWGQILVKNVLVDSPCGKRSTKCKVPLPMDDLSHGVKATVIDLGLSRMDAGDGGSGSEVHWTPFDEEMFEGEGDYQFDVYRIMREHNGGEWEVYQPLTNVMWLHYLSLKLLHGKRLKPPAATKASTRTPKKPTSSTNTWTEKECYECLMEVEAILAVYVDACRSKKGNGKKRGRKVPVKSLADGGLNMMTSAGDVRKWGIGRGWVR